MAAQFKVGGKVVCVEGGTISTNDGTWRLEIKEKEIYHVFGLLTCPCGALMLDIGFKQPNTGRINVSYCGVCNQETTTDVAYLDSEYFVPIEEQEAKTVTYTKKPQDIPVIAN